MTQQIQNTWQLSWNAKSYDSVGRMQLAAACEGGKRMLQSWGRSSTSNVDKIKVGDTLYISCNKKCIGKATVEEAFSQFETRQADPFSISKPGQTNRQENMYYCQIRITEVYLGEHQKDLRGNQNTLCNPAKAFWK
jgi:hypothetical protein